ncbi:Gfo/Idh/MocA family oxidoreductase [Opitutaceae bacterium]|nr:Gfo/Idh/MocA family oxidoreductase [Opitutaceae bacterium]MDB4474343.1 Gfo/Idh/MocA family oxidoreductase [Opitutaceae bacterium]
MKHIDRRSFLAKSCLIGLGASVLPAGRALASPDRKIRHACIGLGGMGFLDYSAIAAHADVEIVAICDIDTARAKKVQELVPQAKFYQDWRELLEKEEIDSVNVSTPDHMHAAITMTALAKGYHVYCQKPLTHDIYEARMIGAKAAETGLVTQMGTQLVSMTAERIGVEWIRRETLGKIREVYLWSNKPALQYRPMGPRPERADPVPAHVDWNAWLGTAPERPYVEGVYHPTWWRGWQDFGCGWLGDMGCHIMDMPFRALGLSMPLSVKAEVESEWIADPKRRGETFPQWQIVEYLYPGTDLTANDTIKLTWSDGGKYPPDELRKHIDGGEWPTQGVLVLGENGAMLKVHRGGPRLFPREKFAHVRPAEFTPQDHYGQFVDAMLGKNGGRTHSPFPYAAQSTEMVLMGTIALRFPGQKLNWDAEGMRFTNVPEANQYVRRTYRQGWEVEGL